MKTHRRRFRLASPTGTKADDEPGFDLSSLIDISFLLLIYFLVTSTLHPKEADLGLTLGGTPPTTEKTFIPEPFQVNIDPAGSVTVGTMMTDPSEAGRELPGLLDSLRVYLATQKMLAEEPLVIINVADEARSQRFIDVLNCVAGEKVEKVTFGDFLLAE